MTDTTVDAPGSTTPPDELGHRRRVAALGEDIADLLKDLVDRGKEYRELGVPAREWLQEVGKNLSAKPARILGWLSDYVAPVIDIGIGFLDGRNLDEAMVDAFHAGASLGGPQAQPTVSIDPSRMSLSKAREFARIVVDGSPPLDPDPQWLDPTQALVNLAQCFLGYDAELLDNAETPQTIRMRKVIDRLFADAPTKNAAGEDQRPAIEAHVILRGMTAPLLGILSTTPEGVLHLGTPTQHNGATVLIEQFFDYSDVVAVTVFRDVKVTAAPRIITPS